MNDFILLTDLNGSSAVIRVDRIVQVKSFSTHTNGIISSITIDLGSAGIASLEVRETVDYIGMKLRNKDQ